MKELEKGTAMRIEKAGWKIWTGLIAGVIIGCSVSVSGWAGQVVTPELRQWAKKALEQEKGLQGLQGRNTLSVLYFLGKGDDPRLVPLQKGLAIMLITDLKKLEKFQVVDRVHLQALVDELHLSQSGLIDESTGIRLGKVLKARWLVGGQLGVPGKNRLSIFSYLLDAPKRKTLGTPDVEGLFHDLLRLEKELLFKIIDTLQIVLTDEQRKELEQPVTRNVSALMAYFKGINASDHQDYEKAAGYYNDAKTLDPRFRWPGIALEELIHLHLITPLSRQKRIRAFTRSLRDRTSLTDSLGPAAPTKRIRKPDAVPVAPVQEPSEQRFVTGVD